jgi:hypothetical protein
MIINYDYTTSSHVEIIELVWQTTIYIYIKTHLGFCDLFL